MVEKKEIPIVVIDEREQIPWEFPDDVPSKTGSLYTGDYSIRGFEDVFAVERKSLPDFVSCVTHERGRFEREMARMRGLIQRAVIVEASMEDVVEKRYRSKTLPSSVIGSMVSWQSKYKIPIVLAGNPVMARDYFVSMSRNFIRHLSSLIKKYDIVSKMDDFQNGERL